MALSTGEAMGEGMVTGRKLLTTQLLLERGIMPTQDITSARVWEGGMSSAAAPYLIHKHCRLPT